MYIIIFVCTCVKEAFIFLHILYSILGRENVKGNCENVSTHLKSTVLYLSTLSPFSLGLAWKLFQSRGVITEGVRGGVVIKWGEFLCKTLSRKLDSFSPLLPPFTLGGGSLIKIIFLFPECKLAVQFLQARFYI